MNGETKAEAQARIAELSSEVQAEKAFERMVINTRTQLEATAGHGRAIAAVRELDYANAAGHVSYMLVQALAFYRANKIGKANRWLGFAQGVMLCEGWASLEELKRCNMPPGAEYDAERVSG